jgi:hypothetical protein
MSNLVIRIVRLIEDGQPRVVQTEFMDVTGQMHTFIDKEPIFTEKDSPSNSFPLIGFLRCEVLERWQDSRGQQIAKITTARPDGLVSTDGLTEFVVSVDSLFEGTWDGTSLTIPLA